MPPTPSSKVRASSRPTRLALASVVAGFSLGAPLLAPTAASAAVGDSFTILYNTEAQPGTATPYAQSNNGVASLFDGFVRGVLTELAPVDGVGQVRADFTSNFATDAEFAVDFVFNIFNQIDPQIPYTALSATCIPGAGTTCKSPGTDYDLIGSGGFNGSFISSTGWNIRLNTPPPPGAGTGAVLGGRGEIISFVISAPNLNINSFQAATLGNNPNGFISCTHGQGLPNLSKSTEICGNKSFNGSKVPGPLPLLGAAAAFGYSRKIRTRIQSSRQLATIS